MTGLRSSIFSAIEMCIVVADEIVSAQAINFSPSRCQHAVPHLQSLAAKPTMDQDAMADTGPGRNGRLGIHVLEAGVDGRNAAARDTTCWSHWRSDAAARIN